MSFSKRLYKKRRKKNPNGLISEHAQPGKIQSRYIDFTPLQYFPLFQPKFVETKDCSVELKGSSCSVSTGEVSFILRNEPTEGLKNKKPAIHQRVCAYGPDLGHDPRYGGWIDPFEFVSKPKKKPKTYDYY